MPTLPTLVDVPPALGKITLQRLKGFVLHESERHHKTNLCHVGFLDVGHPRHRALLGTPAYADYSASAETEAALSDAQTRYENALAQIDYLNDQYFDAEAQYNYILDQINDTQTQIDQLQADIEAKQVELSQAQDILYDRVAASYRAGNVALIDVLLAGDRLR